MEIEDKVVLKEVWEKPYQLGGRDTRADRQGPDAGTISDGGSISGEVVGTVSDEGLVLGKGKVGRRRVYTIPGLNRSGRVDNSSKQGRILISGNDSTCVEKKDRFSKKTTLRDIRHLLEQGS
jgi:hypothetical protein